LPRRVAATRLLTALSVSSSRFASLQDAEKLLSFLTVPYMRIPLVVSFFASKDRVPHLLNR
jgi:hypothetical protein